MKWLCAYCGEEMPNQNAASWLSWHLRRYHGWPKPRNGARTIKCQLCGKRFVLADAGMWALARHLVNDCETYRRMAVQQAIYRKTLPPYEEPQRKKRKKKPAPPKCQTDLARAEELLATWERKLKLATTKAKKYRKLVAKCKRACQKQERSKGARKT